MKLLKIIFSALGVAQAQRSAAGGYAAPGNSEGGIFQAGYISDNAEFGNTYSAQNVQPCNCFFILPNTDFQIITDIRHKMFSHVNVFTFTSVFQIITNIAQTSPVCP